MDQVLLLNILIKKDLEDIQKVQIKETIEKNIVDKEDVNDEKDKERVHKSV